jgi:hypothetical protein
MSSIIPANSDPFPVINASSPLPREAMIIEKKVPVLTTIDRVLKQLENSFSATKKNLGKITFNHFNVGLTFAAGVTLGVFAGLAFAGSMMTPIGWGIAGGILLLSIIMAVSSANEGQGVATLGGHILLALSGATIGFSAAGIHLGGGDATPLGFGIALGCITAIGGACLQGGPSTSYYKPYKPRYRYD